MEMNVQNIQTRQINDNVETFLRLCLILSLT